MKKLIILLFLALMPSFVFSSNSDLRKAIASQDFLKIKEIIKSIKEIDPKEKDEVIKLAKERLGNIGFYPNFIYPIILGISGVGTFLGLITCVGTTEEINSKQNLLPPLSFKFIKKSLLKPIVNYINKKPLYHDCYAVQRDINDLVLGSYLLLFSIPLLILSFKKIKQIINNSKEIIELLKQLPTTKIKT